MGARAIWKGDLKIGSTTVPVKVYAAVEDRTIRFHVLQNRTKSRVKTQMVTEDHGEVAKEEMRKGYEIEPGTFVIVDPSELEELKPVESRVIAFPRFVLKTELGNEWYERPYYLAPDGETEKYFALVEVLATQDLLGIARWTMRGKSYLGALSVTAGYLALIKLRYAEEVLSSRGLTAPGSGELSEKELKMAEELISALQGKFEPTEFRDEYRDRLTKFLEEKARGRHPRLPQIKRRRAEGSLDQQLAKSLATVKRGREKKVA